MRDRVLPCRKGIKKSHFRELIDKPWHAMADLGDQGDGGVIKQRGPAPGCLGAVPDIGAHLLGGHRAQMGRRHHPLGELRHVGAAHHVAQFGLTGENQLQQLVRSRIDVGQHPQLFERLAAEVLRFVENQHHPAPGGVFGDQEALQPVELGDVAFVRADRQPERLQHPLQQLAAAAMGIAHKADGQLGARRFDQVAQQGGLSRPHIAGDQRHRRTGHHPVFQHRPGAAVRRRPVHAARVRGQ